MIKFVAYSIILVALFSCQQTGESCDNLIRYNNSKEEDIDGYYSRIDDWNKGVAYTSYVYSGRMAFLKRYTPVFREGFLKLNESITTRNVTEFNSAKEKITQSISDFLFYTSEVQPWSNNDYFWAIEDLKNDVEQQTISEKCVQIELMESHEIEEDLISMFYLLGYSDEYCFNKMYPEVKTYQMNTEKDTIDFAIGNYAFDSLLCSKVSFTVSNKDFILQDSTSCNWFEVPRKSGFNRFYGIYETSFYGKPYEMEFDDEIYVK